MSAGHFVKQAQRSGMGRKFALSRTNTCSCHPREWGLKKGLRRGRRRLDHEIVLLSLHEADVEATATPDPRGD